MSGDDPLGLESLIASLEEQIAALLAEAQRTSAEAGEDATEEAGGDGGRPDGGPAAGMAQLFGTDGGRERDRALRQTGGQGRGVPAAVLPGPRIARDVLPGDASSPGFAGFDVRLRRKKAVDDKLRAWAVLHRRRLQMDRLGAKAARIVGLHGRAGA